MQNLDVVLVRGNARHLMMLAEAAQSASVAGTGPAKGASYVRASRGKGPGLVGDRSALEKLRLQTVFGG